MDDCRWARKVHEWNGGKSRWYKIERMAGTLDKLEVFRGVKNKYWSKCKGIKQMRSMWERKVYLNGVPRWQKKAHDYTLYKNRRRRMFLLLGGMIYSCSGVNLR